MQCSPRVILRSGDYLSHPHGVACRHARRQDTSAILIEGQGELFRDARRPKRKCICKLFLAWQNESAPMSMESGSRHV